MKNFDKEYIYEQILFNESLGEMLKGFWEWLIGKNNDKKFLPCEHNYDSGELSSTLMKYNKSWNYGIIDLNKVKEFIKTYTMEDKNKSEFSKIEDYINKDFVADKSGNTLWFTIMCSVKEENLRAPACICCVSKNSNDINVAQLRIMEILHMFKKHVGSKQLSEFFKYILTTIKKPINIEKLDIDDILTLTDNSDFNIEPDLSNLDFDSAKKKWSEIKKKKQHITIVKAS